MLSLRRSNSNIALSKRHTNNNNDGDEAAVAENLKSITEEESSEWTSCAIKMLKEGHTDSELKDLVQEMTTMKQIGKHENVISLLGTCVRPGRGSPFYVIVELASKGSLKNYLKQARPPDYRSDYEPPNVTPNHGQFHPGGHHFRHIFSRYFTHCAIFENSSCMTFSIPWPLWQHQNDSQVDVGYWLAGVQRHGIFGHETLFAQRLGGQECPGLWRTRL